MQATLDILLVDGDQMSLTCNKLLLEGAGHRVTAVNSGELALEYAQIRSYDLAFMELTLPELSGEQTAQLLRDPIGGAISPDLMIIALTSKTNREAQQRCQQAGMADFLPKPTTGEELQRAIKSALARRNNTQAA